MNTSMSINYRFVKIFVIKAKKKKPSDKSELSEYMEEQLKLSFDMVY